jgi:carboxypeptidase Taq
MLRFDLEIAVLEGDLAVSDLPQAWNQKMQEYLNLTPPDDTLGVLQDIHWSIGYIGYFPTYTLGNLIANQMWLKMEQDLPDITQLIQQREFIPILDWLREHVHQYGSKYEPMEIVQQITGNGLSAKPYLDYLETKYKEIYRLT